MTDASDLYSMLSGGSSSFFSLAIYVLTVIAWWKLFTKAGEAGWKSIIPIYNMIVLFKLTWKVSKFWLLFVSVFAGVFMISIGIAMQKLGAVGMGVTIVLVLVGAVLLIYGYVLDIISSFKLSKAYGQGTGFGVGLWLLPVIFVLILGFGSAQYVGPQD